MVSGVLEGGGGARQRTTPRLTQQVEIALVDEPQRNRSAWAEALRISDLGLRVVVAVGAGFFGGLWLDRRLATTAFGAGLHGFPLLAVIGTVLGFGAGMVALVRGLTSGERVAPSRKPGSGDAAASSDAEDDADETDAKGPRRPR